MQQSYPSRGQGGSLIGIKMLFCFLPLLTSCLKNVLNGSGTNYGEPVHNRSFLHPSHWTCDCGKPSRIYKPLLFQASRRRIGSRQSYLSSPWLSITDLDTSHQSYNRLLNSISFGMSPGIATMSLRIKAQHARPLFLAQEGI